MTLIESVEIVGCVQLGTQSIIGSRRMKGWDGGWVEILVDIRELFRPCVASSFFKNELLMIEIWGSRLEVLYSKLIVLPSFLLFLRKSEEVRKEASGRWRETLTICEAEPGGTSSLLANNATKMFANMSHIGWALRLLKVFRRWHFYVRIARNIIVQIDA